MKQKSYKWTIYLLFLAIIGAVIYIATKNITPISHHIEKEISVNYGK